MKLGLIQGRLSRPIEGFQDTPEAWRREFADLRDVGLNHIEWIITKESFSTNPFFTENLKKYPIFSVCADNLVDKNIDDINFVSNMLNPICVSALNNDVEYVTIPLLEQSSLLDRNKRDRFKEILLYFLKQYPTIKFSLEAEMPAKMIMNLASISENCYVTYDTGNITSCGYNHEKYIECVFDKICNVHLKDRTLEGKTVIPSTGDTNFETIFKALTKNQYKGVFTLQTAREKDGEEKTTIRKHTNILRGIYEKCI